MKPTRTSTQPAPHVPDLPPAQPAPLSVQERDRAHWGAGQRVHHRVFGLGTVIKVGAANGSGPLSPRDSVTAEFRGAGVVVRPLATFTPVFSLDTLIKRAQLDPSLKSRLRMDPRLTPDVPVSAEKGIAEPFYRVHWVSWLKDNFASRAAAAPVRDATLPGVKLATPPRDTPARSATATPPYDTREPDSAPAPRPRQAISRRIHRSGYRNKQLANPAKVSLAVARRAREGLPLARASEEALHTAIDVLDSNSALPAQPIGPRGVSAMQRVLRGAVDDGWSYRVIAALGHTDPSLPHRVLSHGTGMTRVTANALIRGARILKRSSAPMPELSFDAPSLKLLRARLAPIPRDLGVILIPRHAVALAQVIRAARANGVEVSEHLVPHQRPSPLGRDDYQPRLDRAWAILEDLEHQRVAPRPPPVPPPRADTADADAAEAEPGPETVSPEALANLERSRWRPGAHVFGQNLGVGVVERVIDASGEGPHSPDAIATVRFPGPIEVSRTVQSLEPVLSLTELLELAGLPESMARDVQSDPRLIPDVMPHPKDPEGQPFYGYRWVEHVRRAHKRISQPRADALRRMMRHAGYAPYPLSREAGISRTTVANAAAGRPVTPSSADWIQATIGQLDQQGAPKTLHVGSRAVLRALERTQALGWEPEACALTGKVSSRFLAMLESGRVKSLERSTSLDILRGLRALRAAAAPLPELRFTLQDIESLEARFALVRTGPFHPLVPALHTAFMQIVADAHRRGISLKSMRLGVPRQREQVAMGKARAVLELLREHPALTQATP